MSTAAVTLPARYRGPDPRRVTPLPPSHAIRGAFPFLTKGNGLQQRLASARVLALTIPLCSDVTEHF